MRSSQDEGTPQTDGGQSARMTKVVKCTACRWHCRCGCGCGCKWLLRRPNGEGGKH